MSALASGSSGPGSSPGRAHYVVSLGKTLYSHSVSLHPGLQIGNGEFNAGGDPAIFLASHPGGGEGRNTPSHFVL